MKKIFVMFMAAMSLIACEKSSIKETADSIKRADSLFTKANEGLKTLDSISKTINDSNGIARKVIIPEIERQKKRIDSTLKSGGYKMDSINREVEKITKNVKTGTEVVKTLDSANRSIQNGESAIKVLTRTADKILKQTKTADKTQNGDAEKRATETTPPVVYESPVVKNAQLEIQVNNLNTAKALLKQKIRENNGTISQESFSQNEGAQRENFAVKVPLQQFDELVANLSSDLGDVQSKSLESEGTKYDPSQNCDIQLVLIQNDQLTGTASGTENDSGKKDTFGEKSSGAFMKGFRVLGEAFVFLLPFWPVFLLAALIFYFLNRNRRKKLQDLKEAQQGRETVVNPFPAENQTSTTLTPTEENLKNEKNPDYSKYLPKN